MSCTGRSARYTASPNGGYPIEALATDTSFMGLGLDSLVAMTLSNHLRRDYAVSIPVTQILLSTSLEALAREVQAARERVITRAGD